MDRTSSQSTLPQITIVALMVSFSAMSYFDRTIMSIAGPSIIREFGISETAMGTVYSAFLISYALLMGPGGGMADRYGPRLTLAVVGLGGALFTAATGFSGDPGLGALIGVLPALFLSRILFGATSAPLYPACARMTANWFARLRRGRVQGLVISGAAIGAALSPILTTGVVGNYGWQTSFQLAAAATLALSLLWLWLARDRPPQPPPDPGASGAGAVDATPAAREVFPLVQLLKNRNLGILTAGYFCLNYFEYIFFYWIYYYFGEIRKMGSDESAVYTTIMMATMAVSTPLGGWVSDRLVTRFGKTAGLRAVPIAGLGLSAVLLYAGAREDLEVVTVVVLLAASFGLATATEGAYWAAAIEVSGVHPGAGGGIMNSVGNVGGVLSPVLTPLLAREFGWAAGLHFASLLVALSVAAWFFFRPEAEPSKPEHFTSHSNP